MDRFNKWQLLSLTALLRLTVKRYQARCFDSASDPVMWSTWQADPFLCQYVPRQLYVQSCPKSSIRLKCSEKMVQCTMRKTWYLSWQWVELIAAQMWTNLPGSKMQRCLCKPKCARQRACTTFFPCSVSMTDLNVCSSKKERGMNLKKCKHFVKGADRKAKRNYQSANWLDMKSSASQVCYEVWSITRSQFIPKKDQKKKMCSCTLSSQQELWVI